MSPAENTAGSIIVVDDESGIRDMVAEYLGSQGFSVRKAGGGQELRALIAEQAADIILLDVNMPGEDGFSVARSLRADSRQAIIMVTASDDLVDKVAGLEIGADDYVTKPFDLRELKARIRAVLRRVREAQAHARAPETPSVNETASNAEARGLVAFGRVFVDREARTLVNADGSEEPVTAMEYDLIEVFLANPHRVLSRDRLLDLAHRKNDDPFDRSIDIRVTRLRKKIEEDPSKPQTIRTVRGVGYLYAPGGKG